MYYIDDPDGTILTHWAVMMMTILQIWQALIWIQSYLPWAHTNNIRILHDNKQSIIRIDLSTPKPYTLKFSTL